MSLYKTAWLFVKGAFHYNIASQYYKKTYQFVSQ